LRVATPASLKNALTITLTLPSSCVSKTIYGIRYLWRETACEFKQAAIYSSTDSNLPSPPYMKVFRKIFFLSYFIISKQINNIVFSQFNLLTI
jgi:hypothetical protein